MLNLIEPSSHPFPYTRIRGFTSISSCSHIITHEVNFMHGVIWFLSIASAPEPVSSLVVNSRTTITVSLSWTYQFDESSTRTGVQIEVTKGNDLVSNITLPPSAINTTLFSLEPQTMYTIAVYVVNANGRSRPIFITKSTLSLRKWSINHYHYDYSLILLTSTILPQVLAIMTRNTMVTSVSLIKLLARTLLAVLEKTAL